MSKSWLWLVGLVAVVVAIPLALVHAGGGGWLHRQLVALHGGALHASAPHSPAPTDDVVLPFELAMGHIMLPVTVNESAPLSFMLDTGDKYGIIDLDLARELKLALGGAIQVHGVGAAMADGALVNDATFAIAGLTGAPQTIALAVPLSSMASALGRRFDGIFGAEFLANFVVEIDYDARQLVLHRRDTFDYHGSGEVLPIRIDSFGHPIVKATLTPIDKSPLQIDLMVDVGSNGSLVLNSPFVNEHHLPSPGQRTIRALGQSGAGGHSSGVEGRVASLQLGAVTLSEPATVFSNDTGGAFAATDNQGNLGQRILERFHVILDYARSRIILEPLASVHDPFAATATGMRIESGGADFTDFHVLDVLDGSPASEAGVHIGDRITSIDGRPARDFTLTRLSELFRQPTSRSIVLERDGKTVTVSLTPRPLI